MTFESSRDDSKFNPQTAPDPDEDDLDDLDEMLDEFSSTKINTDSPAPPASGPSGPGRPAPAVLSGPLPQPSSDLEDNFAKELQAGMADMLKELETNPDMARQFEEMLAQFGAPSSSSLPTESQTASRDSATTMPPPTSTSTTPSDALPANRSAEDNFQDTIRRTMDRMKASSSSADAAATNPLAGDDDIMASLLRELQEANGGADGEGDDTFSKMLLGMMEQLTNKEILYEPMKELDTKFPAWLQNKKATLPKEEEKRYTEQSKLVKEIVQRFERKGYSDSNAEDREFIVDRMQRMQAAGAPPPDLVGDVDAAASMMNDLDAGCPQQ